MPPSYDYIIVGAGSAGCVLANRLSADPSVRVLLLEAGPTDLHPFVAMPAAFTFAIGSRRFDWRYVSQPEPYLGDREIPCPRGLVLGGSSSINAMAFVRGQAEDYEEWTRLGAHGWGYADCLPYFKRLETFVGPSSPWRGTTGPLHVTAPAYSNPLNEAFLRACRDAGHKLSPDTNGPDQEGFGPMDQTIHRGRRESTSRAYLRPIGDRGNLKVLTRCHALRIGVEGNRARSVTFTARGAAHTSRADREIILSAGAINTPKLLLQSGIGPADELRRLGIDVLRDLPGVGRNLQDHVDAPLRHACPLPITVTPALQFHRQVPIFLNWLLFKRGWGATNHFEVAGYIRSGPEASRPDAQICFMPLVAGATGTGMNVSHGFQLSIMVLQPRSRGTVTLASADPGVAPVLRFNYLKEPADLAPLINGIRRTREILCQKSFERFLGPELFPGRDANSDAELERYIRATAKSTHHPCGTCRMGSDEEAVVDPDGRVRGLDNLRVVDASIMPAITSGNINAPVIMLAEKLADAILRSAL